MQTSGTLGDAVVAMSSVNLQVGGKNESKEVKMPAGLTRLFKSKLDWNLYSSLQEAANNRQASSYSLVQSFWLG